MIITKKIICYLVFSAIIFAYHSVKGQASSSFLMDMVHHNPGEALTQSKFTSPSYLKKMGYNAIVYNDFIFAQTALTFDKLNPEIFPKGSKERIWVMEAAKHVRENIAEAHANGLKAYYFTDIFVLPKKLVEIYKDEICNEKGEITLDKPKTLEIHKIMLDELFETFLDLDGLVVRTGETYLNNVPYHTGNDPIQHGVEDHVKLINFLRTEVCVKRNKMIFYRTWLSAGMDKKPEVYLNVTNQIKPHPNLVFSIKHTSGDYQRTLDFNPTLGIGNHPQIVEVQCQREYEGKGSYPNYIGEGVINGFEEYFANKPQPGNKGLSDLKANKDFRGVWTWSRGGGWVGPYIKNEFWCTLNAYVISKWAQDTELTEEEVFGYFMDENGIQGESREKFRELCLLSAQAVLRGHNSAVLDWKNGWVWWMRDQFLGGTDKGTLKGVFKALYEKNELDVAIAEKYEAVEIWKKIVKLSTEVHIARTEDQVYLKVSSQYGLILHQIIAEGWNIMALGYKGDVKGVYDLAELKASIIRYDEAWKRYYQLKRDNPSCASLYEPYSFVFKAPNYHGNEGMGASVDKYRALLK